jgi:hypothetical protein
MKIRTPLTPALAAALAALVAAAPAAAQPCREEMPRYDTAAEITVTGTVEEIERPESPQGWQGLHLAIAAGDATYEAHLGPAAYVEEQGFTFAVGDQVEIVGAEAVCCGEDALLVRELTRDGTTLRLRDEDGRPLWAGQGQGQRRRRAS